MENMVKSEVKRHTEIPPEYIPDVSNMITEDDTPVDNFLSEKQMRLLSDALYSSWEHEKPFMVMANVGLFYQMNEPALVPDVMISLGVKHFDNWLEKEHRSYFIWEFGKPPEVVVEIVSNLKGEELSRKYDLYEQIRIAYYVVYDPLHCYGDKILRIFRHNGWEYEECSGENLEKIGLSLRLWEGKYEDKEFTWLRWFYNEGSVVPTGKERADAASLLVQQEKERADAAERRLRELEEKLRTLEGM